MVERLRSFTRTSRLERLLLNVAANQLTNKEIDRLADMFRALDYDSDGCAYHLSEPLSITWTVMPKASHREAPPCCISAGCLPSCSGRLSHMWRADEVIAADGASNLFRRLSAEDLRRGLGAVGSQMDSESVKKLANELDISGCGSVNLEVHLLLLHITPCNSLAVTSFGVS